MDGNKIFWRALIVTVLVGVTAAFWAMPDAAAQSDSQYLIPERLDGGAEVVDVPCPDGLSTLYSFVWEDSATGLRYCTAPDGWVPLTTEAECVAANTGARNGLNGEILTGRGFWFEAVGLCFAGGNAAPVAEGGLDKATDCPDLPAEFFFEDIINPGPGTLFDYCIIPMYKQAPSVTTPTGGSATVTTTAGTLGGVQVTSADGSPDLPIPSTNGETTPAADVMPYGLFEFSVSDLAPGATVTITIDLPALPAGATAPSQYWKLHNNTWTQLTTAVFAPQSVTLTLTDGGAGDSDGVANGTIVDPGAPVALAATAGGASVFQQGLGACITSDLVQNDPIAAGLSVGDRFRATDTGVLYQVIGGVPGCALNCDAGLDANCDGRPGDVCPVEYDVSRVQGAGACMAFLSAASQPAVEAPVTEAPAVAVAQPVTQLAHTATETNGLSAVGFALAGLGASALCLRGAIRRRQG